MARSQKTVAALPQNKGIRAATNTPILLPSLKRGVLDHTLQQGLLRRTRRLCSPTAPPTPTRPKKLKMQAPVDMFPTDWSPPPIEFLNPKVVQAGREDAAQRQLGAAGPRELQSLGREVKQDRLGPDPKGNTASLQRFWDVAGPGQPAVAAQEDDHTPLTPGGSEKYINSLDYLLQEKRMLVEKFSVSLQAIPSVHPGETVFLPRHHPLPCALDSSQMEPHSHLEGLFLSSSQAQQLSFLHHGLLSNLYLHRTSCPVPLLQWLFQLLTWPPETSSRAFDLLWDLSVDGLFRQSDEEMYLWYPSLQEVMEVFYSLGAYCPALYPLGPCQHGDQVTENEAGLDWQVDSPQQSALDISLSYIYKILTLCALARPGAYTDGNLLGLIEQLCRTGLDVGLRLLPKTDLQQLLLLLLENIQDWPGKLQQLCCALSWVSDHHHNLLALVQFFLEVTSRSRQLRSRLSLMVIARMLGQQEALPVWQEKTQLSLLSRLLSLMRPSSLGQCLGSDPLPPCQKQQPMTGVELDHKATAESWISSGAARTRTSAHMGCQHCRRRLYPLRHGPGLWILFFAALTGSSLKGLLPVPQPADPGRGGGQQPGHHSRPMGGAAAALHGVGPPHQHPYPGEPPGHAQDQPQGPGHPDLHPLARAAGPLPAPGPVLQCLEGHVKGQGSEVRVKGRGSPDANQPDAAKACLCLGSCPLPPTQQGMGLFPPGPALCSPASPPPSSSSPRLLSP
ncbi:protein FAM178B isoform X3 [Oryctolagus cuniculus]|uniref:protein FAM178B isoform X3 n=1 Tax=Oryctolagus cuniculus TaxID=9986 RepID=UPI00387A2B84